MISITYSSNNSGNVKKSDIELQTRRECVVLTNNSGGQAFNSKDFKAQQRQMWDNAAAGWQAWWPTFERGAQKVSDKLVQLAEIRSGDWVLDIATGLGEPAVTAARKVMPDGKVVATDISPQMLEVAKTRAKSLGLDSVIEFRESDGEKIDLPELTAKKFDAILSRWGLMFFPNLPVALGLDKCWLQTAGFLRAVWSAPSKVPLSDLAFSTVRKQLNIPAPPPGATGPFALADTDTLRHSFSQAGFKDIKIDTFQITFEFDSPDS